MKTIDILISRGIIVTMDSQRRIIDGGSIAIEKDKVIDIGTADEIEKKYNAEKIIDATKKLVLPGLINCHTHASGSLYRGVGDDLDLEQAGSKIYFPCGHDPTIAYPPRNIYIGTLLSCLEYIKSGSTCIVNLDGEAPEVARAFDKAGIRGVLAPFMNDVLWTPDEESSGMPDRKKIVDDAVEFFNDWNGKAEGRIRCWFGNMTELATSKELLIDIVELAGRYDTGIHVHLGEALFEVNAIRKTYGKRSIEYANDLGLLRPGTLISHCCWLTPHEITLLARSGVSVVHSPVTEMKISDGICPIPQLMESGVNVSLGTDSTGQNNGTTDLVREMKTATLLHKVNYPLDPEILTAEKVLEMATVNGAKAVMWDDELGSLEKGKKADIILVDLDKPRLTPILRKPKFNIVNLFVYSAVGDDVDTMIVNGKIIMLHRKILTLDEDKIMEEAQATAEELMTCSGVDKQSYPWRWSI